jgi:cytochrome P450
MTTTLPTQGARPRATPPGPKPVPVTGLSLRDLLAFRRDPPGFLLDMARRYGDLVYLKAGQQNFYLLNHPDLVEAVLVKHHRSFKKGPAVQATRAILGNGLLTSEEGYHLRQRRLIQPMFHRQRIEGYGQAMVHYATQMAARWQPGVGLDVARAMMALTMSIVGKTLFGTDVEAEAAAVGGAMHTLTEAFAQVNGPLGVFYRTLRLPAVRRAEQARDQLNAIMYRLVAEHRAQGDQGDLLSMLLAAQDEDDGQSMTDEQVRDEAMTLFLAGHETTANALNWTWYVLSQNPAAEAQLHAELDTALAGRPPAAQDLPRLPYTRMVLAEAMRLYPPVWVIGRAAREDVALGGYTIPAGATVITSQWVLHHDARYYPEPFVFQPERWTPEAQAQRPKFAYFPFGGGPRLCIGEQFAWMEGSLLLATLAQQWRLRLAPGQRVEPRASITLRPKHGLVMVPVRR